MKKNNTEEIEVSIGENDSELIERLKEIILNDKQQLPINFPIQNYDY